MCGIAALFAYHYVAPEVDRRELRLLRDSMTDRGPDGFGEWISEDRRAGLAHRRLAVIDLSRKGAQPMSNELGTAVVSFNGEIYNYRELRSLLEAKGRVFRSQSDTEVLLRLYEEKGEAMLHDLRGMFAFILWDAKRRVMLLVRDSFGIKPLYYADDGWTVRAASQVKALLQSEKVSRLPEPAGIVGFFLMGSVPEPYTTYQEIRQVPAGSFVRVNELGASSPERYFSVAEVFQHRFDEMGGGGREAEEIVREALGDSVRHHFVSDVPVGAFLSGGVDSGTLVGIAADLKIKELRTLTLAFEEFRGKPEDEAPLAGEAARLYGTKHETRILTAEEFKADLDRFLEKMDQPTIDGLNIYFVSKAARERGLKVALSGLGGDELFGGYDSFRQIPQMVPFLALPSRIPFLGDLFRTAFPLTLSLSPRGEEGRVRGWRFSFNPKYAGLLKYGGSYAGAYLLKRGLFMPWELESVLERDLVRDGLERLNLLRRTKEALVPDPGSGFGRVATLEASFYLRNQLLRDADWAGMAHSIEIRTPFVDVNLWRSLAPLLAEEPESKNGLSRKRLLIRSPRFTLPYEVLRRPKTGFTVPMERWLASEERLDAWRRIPGLAREGTPWARRWAYALMHQQDETSSVFARPPKAAEAICNFSHSEEAEGRRRISRSFAPSGLRMTEDSSQ